MRFLVITSLISLYLIWRAAWPLGSSRKVRWAIAALLVGLILHYPFIAYFWGSFASPEVPREILLSLAAGFMTLLLLATFLLLRDIAGGLVWLVSRDKGRALLANRRIVQGLAVLCLSLAGYGVWQAIKVPDIKRIEITLPGLPVAFDGYRITHLTDLHVSRLLDGARTAKVVARANSLNADAIMISGDLIDGSVEARSNDYPALAVLSAPDGVFASPGNHEYYSGYRAWMQVFAQMGMRMLANQHAVLRRGDAELIIAGVTDPAAYRSGQPQPDLAAALAGVSPDASIILLDHRPGNAAYNRQAGVDLQLSGHTHGGHILGLHWLVARFNNGYVSGLYPLESMQLYVGNGAGLWPGFAIRLGKPAEITEITLRTSP